MFMPDVMATSKYKNAGAPMYTTCRKWPTRFVATTIGTAQRSRRKARLDLMAKATGK